MKVSNIRFGFATNSSSTHSIIFNQKLEDNYWGQEFGWDEFVLSSPEAKKLYLAQTLRLALVPTLGEELAGCVVRDLIQVIPDPEGYVDHQSCMQLPNSPKTNQISIQFFQELVERYLRPDIVIVGGNDNSDSKRFDSYDCRNHLIPVDTSDLFCRKDGEWWLLQNRHTGTKIRLTFNDNAAPYTKSKSPELVDLKITDMCLMNCLYCYQNSTINGKHGDLIEIYRVIQTLADIGVFEIALGGGEPTRHPYFSDIVSAIHHAGMLVNFSTRDLDWTEHNGIVKTVSKYVSRFAVSVQYGSDVSIALQQIPDELHSRVYFHYVIGTGSLKSIFDSKDIYGYPLILLGFKHTGRGKGYRHDTTDSNWLELVKKSYMTIGVDTALATEYKDKIKDLNQSLVTYGEGKFSMYVDAVEMKMGKCSYADSYTSVKNLKAEDYLREFAAY